MQEGITRSSTLGCQPRPQASLGRSPGCWWHELGVQNSPQTNRRGWREHAKNEVCARVQDGWSWALVIVSSLECGCGADAKHMVAFLSGCFSFKCYPFLLSQSAGSSLTSSFSSLLKFNSLQILWLAPRGLRTVLASSVCTVFSLCRSLACSGSLPFCSPHSSWRPCCRMQIGPCLASAFTAFSGSLGPH